MTREQLGAVYRDWVNNFITLEYFSEYYGLHIDEANRLIDLARDVSQRKHPDE